MSARPPAVVVDGATKSFRLPHERMHTLKERALHPFHRGGHDRLDALQDVSFAVEPGEFFGIVGRNGSGKSTLLKCMAGIYGLDGGSIYVNGNLSTFIELGVGFNPDLAAYDNVVMNGIMLGLTPREARARYDEVLAFAELEEFADLKLKNYSSGMHVRLAFSVMIQVGAEIMLIDEVLAVGDAAFQQKCFDVFNDLRDQGRTILFVTHDMGAVERFCHRAMLIDRGQVVAIGEPHDIAASYLELNFKRDLPEITPESFPEQQGRGGDGRARVQEVWIEDGNGERKETLLQGEPAVLHARIRFFEDVEDPVVAVTFVNEGKQNQFVANTAMENERSGRFAAGEDATLTLRFENVFAPGRYFVSMIVAHRGSGENVIDRYERVFWFLTVGTRAAGGLVDLPHDLRLERSPERSAR